MLHKITGIDRRFVRKIVRHYLHYDKENPFIFIAALLAFLGIAAGVMVLMIAMGIMNGTQKEFEKKLFVMNYPLTLLPIEEGALNTKTIETIKRRFPDFRMSPYYTTQAIARANGEVQGVLLYGVDFKKEAAINKVFAKAYAERNDTGTFDAIVGEGLSIETDTGVGKKLTLYFTRESPAGFATLPLQKRFLVTAIFKSGLNAYDKAIVYTTYGAFQKILKRPKESFDGVHIYTKDAMGAYEQLRKILPPNVTVEGWWQQNGNFFSAMEMEKKALFLVLMLIILVASLNIVSALLMTVMSRRSEIALMRTLGATAKEIKAIFFKLGLVIGAGGILTGTLLGALGIWALKTFDIITLPADVYGTSKLPVDLTTSDFTMILLGTALIVVLSSRYPAKKAAKTDPLKVLRNE